LRAAMSYERYISRHLTHAHISTRDTFSYSSLDDDIVGERETETGLSPCRCFWMLQFQPIPCFKQIFFFVRDFKQILAY
jgi:hypothetical protein